MHETNDVQSIHRDIEGTLGHVPEFIKHMPPSAVGGFWSTMKQLELGETKIPLKYKELIGVAVASSIPCEYCTHFHTEAAKLHGANQDELDEAVGVAALTRAGSTILNGTGQDITSFKAEMRDIVKFVKQNQTEIKGKTTVPR